MAIFVAMAHWRKKLSPAFYLPTAVQPPRRPESSEWAGISLGLDGDLLAICTQADHSSAVLTAEGETSVFTPAPNGRFSFSHVQRFSDGCWFVIGYRGGFTRDNAFVFKPDGTLSHSFDVGASLETVLVDASDRIWIGYIDEGVIGGIERYGKNGLVRLDREGNVEFGFNETVMQLGEKAPASSILDVYALTVDEQGRAWFCAYTEFELVFVDGNEIHAVMGEVPVADAEAITVGPRHVAFYGGYDDANTVTVVDLETRRIRQVHPLGPDGAPLVWKFLATRGRRAIALCDDALYRLDLDLLLTALGPWTNRNSVVAMPDR